MEPMEVYDVEDVYTKRHRKTMKDLMQDIIGYVAQVGTGGDPTAIQLLEETVEVLKSQKEIDDCNDNDANAPNNLNDTLKAIQLSLARIERKETAPPVPKNYATAAASGQSNWNSTLSGKDPLKSKPNSAVTAKQAPKDKAPSPKEARRAREITVHITNEADKEKMKALPTKDLVEALQADTNGIRGVSRLLSGDIKVHTESLEAKKALQEETGWTRKMAESATVQLQTFSVRANGIKMENIKIANQPMAIEYLQAANARLHPGLKITKLAWSLRATREKKIYSTLHMEVATAAMANRLITEGMMEDYEIKDCERFTKGCTMTQCFNCQKYGHIGKSCRNAAACGHCAGGHQSKECTLEATGQYRRCAVCGDRGHEAWSTACKIRKAEKKKSELAMQNRAPLYTIASPPFRFEMPILNLTTQATETVSSQPWSTVGSKKRKVHNIASHSPESNSTSAQSEKKLSWDNINIMNPENMAKALAKPALGRPRIDSRVEPIVTTTSPPVSSTDNMDTL